MQAGRWRAAHSIFPTPSRLRQAAAALLLSCSQSRSSPRQQLGRTHQVVPQRAQEAVRLGCRGDIRQEAVRCSTTGQGATQQAVRYTVHRPCQKGQRAGHANQQDASAQPRPALSPRAPAMQDANLVVEAVSTLSTSSGELSPRQMCAAAVHGERLPCRVQATASVLPAGMCASRRSPSSAFSSAAPGAVLAAAAARASSMPLRVS